ncbi:MAG: hypothetical protein KJO26_15765, partial [Deltaproteobacteria bacterium]|nr:hypothetical protein [Deltaproteobacteria bacterium]
YKLDGHYPGKIVPPLSTIIKKDHLQKSWSDPEGSRIQGFEDPSEILNIIYKFLIHLKLFAAF